MGSTRRSSIAKGLSSHSSLVHALDEGMTHRSSLVPGSQLSSQCRHAIFAPIPPALAKSSEAIVASQLSGPLHEKSRNNLKRRHKGRTLFAHALLANGVENIAGIAAEAVEHLSYPPEERPGLPGWDPDCLAKWLRGNLAVQEAFTSLPDEGYRTLAAQAVHVTIDTYEQVCKEGAPAEFRYVVLAGHCVANQKSTTTTRRNLAYMPWAFLRHQLGAGIHAIQSIEVLGDTIQKVYPNELLARIPYVAQQCRKALRAIEEKGERMADDLGNVLASRAGGVLIDDMMAAMAPFTAIAGETLDWYNSLYAASTLLERSQSFSEAQAKRAPKLSLGASLEQAFGTVRGEGDTPKVGAQGRGPGHEGSIHIAHWHAYAWEALPWGAVPVVPVIHAMPMASHIVHAMRPLIWTSEMLIQADKANHGSADEGEAEATEPELPGCNLSQVGTNLTDLERVRRKTEMPASNASSLTERIRRRTEMPASKSDPPSGPASVTPVVQVPAPSTIHTLSVAAAHHAQGAHAFEGVRLHALA